MSDHSDRYWYIGGWPIPKPKKINRGEWAGIVAVWLVMGIVLFIYMFFIGD